ncbi:MAG: serine hydrolase [Acidobacteriota bacterium]
MPTEMVRLHILPRIQRRLGAVLFVLMLSCVAEPVRQIQYAPPATPAELGLAGYAKVICSAVFVSGRDHREALINSGYFFLAEEDREHVTDVRIDRDEMSVTMTLRGNLTRKARFYGDQGCVIHPTDHDGVYFQPVQVRTRLPDASTQLWPMGDQMPVQQWPPQVDSGKLQAAVEAAFADPAGLTAAFLVVYKGQILAERYAPGIDKDTQLESWSMGKSLTAALVGILVGQGHFGLDDLAPVPDWRQEGDPRSKIRIADLMRMSSGLRFIAPHDPDYSPDMGYPDHMYIYSGAIDAFEYSISRPLQFEPNTEGRYRNSDPLTLGYIVRETVRRQGEEYLTFPQRALFDRIGIRKMVLETDPYGNFLLTGYDYGTARNWARLGMLYLQDGVWQGDRILPQGWAEFVSTPAPAWKEPVYGGLFWLNRNGAWNLPSQAYFMAGGGGQRVFVVPSLDLVIVRMGHFRGMAPGMAALNQALELITEAVG